MVQDKLFTGRDISLWEESAEVELANTPRDIKDAILKWIDDLELVDVDDYMDNLVVDIDLSEFPEEDD